LSCDVLDSLDLLCRPDYFNRRESEVSFQLSPLARPSQTEGLWLIVRSKLAKVVEKHSRRPSSRNSADQKLIYQIKAELCPCFTGLRYRCAFQGPFYASDDRSDPLLRSIAYIGIVERDLTTHP